MTDKKVVAENKRLMALFKGVDENKVDFIRDEIRKLSWYNIRIRELQEKIDKDGITIPFQNGRNQSGLQTNPDMKALIDLQKIVNPIVKTLLPLVPDKMSGSKLEDFFPTDDFSTDDETPEERKEQFKRETEELVERIKQWREETGIMD